MTFDVPCAFGFHDRRVVQWQERGVIRRGPSQPAELYEVTLHGYRCVRCESVEDITNPPILQPGPRPARGHAAGVDGP